MKGLLMIYAIRGLYQLVAALLVLPSAFSVIGVVVYMCVAKRYRNRERDEFCKYAENYYSNPQQEQYYEYD